MGAILKLLRRVISKLAKKSPKGVPPKKPAVPPSKKPPSCKQDCPAVRNNPYKQRTRSQNEQSAKREQELIDEHKIKLEEYKRNPEKGDNLGTYRNAPAEIKKQIYEGRVRALEKQIEKHEKELEKVREALSNE